MTLNSTPCGNIHEITLRNTKNIRIYKIFNNTMYTCNNAAQADVTTATVNVIVMSRTTHFLTFIP